MRDVNKEAAEELLQALETLLNEFLCLAEEAHCGEYVLNCSAVTNARQAIAKAKEGGAA